MNWNWLQISITIICQSYFFIVALCGGQNNAKLNLFASLARSDVLSIGCASFPSDISKTSFHKSEEVDYRRVEKNKGPQHAEKGIHFNDEVQHLTTTNNIIFHLNSSTHKNQFIKQQPSRNSELIPLSSIWQARLSTHLPVLFGLTHPELSNSVTSKDIYNYKEKHIATISTKRKFDKPHRRFIRYSNYLSNKPATTKKPNLPKSNNITPTKLPLKCGSKTMTLIEEERIVGGTNAKPHEFPWMAVIFKSGKQFCGGSIITKDHVLTAAHCVSRMTSWDVAALTTHLGDHNIGSSFEANHVSRKIKRLVRHKGFDFSHLHFDIAILTMSEAIQFSSEIQPICLPISATQQHKSYAGQIAVVAGWGSLRENGPQPTTLQKVSIPIWSNSDCGFKYGDAAPGGIIESMLCAGQAAKDSCSGDSGGPIIIKEDGRYVQVGIVSWGIGCGKGQFPGVYTRVTKLLPWIFKNIM